MNNMVWLIYNDSNHDPYYDSYHDSYHDAYHDSYYDSYYDSVVKDDQMCIFLLRQSNDL